LKPQSRQDVGGQICSSWKWHGNHSQPTSILLHAGKRLSVAAYLEQWGPRLFPAYFEAVLHPFFMALLPMDADERVAAMLSSFPQFALFMQPPHSRSSTPKPEPAAGAGAAEAQMSQSRDMSEGLGSLERSMADPGGAAGGLGTQLSSVAGPAMQVSIPPPKGRVPVE
jgi:hypothetical protein